MRRIGKTCCIGVVMLCAALALCAIAVAQELDAPADPAAEGQEAATPEQPPIELALRSDRDTYAVGDMPSYFARSSEDCYLTLVNVDPDGSAVVLFPNEFEQDNLLKAGGELELPMPNSPYRFRLTKAGRERIIAICTQSPRPVAGISHDFERLTFTMLGDWDEFLAAVASGRLRSEPAPSDSRRKRGRGNARPKQEEPAALELPDRQTRTEVSYEVR